MTDSGETIYSTMFSSLKHPARRKVLRMLSEKPTSFSELLEAIEVSSSHLTYHLESLGELVSKTDAGEYKLSTFGEAAVNTMRIVEDAPGVQSRNGKFISIRWKPILAGLIIGIVLLGSFSIIQYNALNSVSRERDDLQAKYDEAIRSGTDKAIRFLRDVIELDLAKYEQSLLSNTVDTPSELGGMSEQIQHYLLVGTDSRLDVTFVFKGNTLSKYQLSVLEGSPIYDKPQPFTALDSAKWLLHQLWFYENAPYLEQMNSTLYQLIEVGSSIQLNNGNMKFNLSVLGSNTEMKWYYTENGVDFAQKGLKLTYNNELLKELDDGYFLYKIGNTQLNIDQAGAIQAARNAVKGYSWTTGGPVISYTVLDQPVSAIFNPTPREEPLTLIPRWYVTLYLDNLPTTTNVNRLAVSIWADTGKIEGIAPLSG